MLLSLPGWQVGRFLIFLTNVPRDWELRGGSSLQFSSARGLPGTVGVSPEPQPAEQRGGGGGAGPSLTWKRAGVASSGTCWWCFEQANCVQVAI